MDAFLKFQYFFSLCFDWIFSREFNNLSQAQLIYGGSSQDQTKNYKFYPFHSHFPLLFCFVVLIQGKTLPDPLPAKSSFKH